MPFAPPAGTELVSHLGAGTVFDVAVVREPPRAEGAPDVALICKRLTPRVLREPAGRAAIIREAKVLALARHPALPRLIRVGADGHGPFVIETRTEGVSLRELVEAWRSRAGGVPALLAAHVARASIEALDQIHALEDEHGPLRVVHGDLGPDNMMLGPIGQIGVIDLGAARWRGMEPDLVTADRGTLPFVAPEVARGDEPPSAAADVYALAATLLYVATGLSPVDASEPAAMLVEVGERGVRVDRIDRAGAFTPEQRRALAAALAFDRGARAEGAGALRAAFAAPNQGPIPRE